MGGSDRLQGPDELGKFPPRVGDHQDRHCTFAVTAAAPDSVNVQVFTLLPPLEQAPDQMTSRPFEALSVIAVPAGNEADPVDPDAALIPAGLETTRSPLRPVAVTVSVALWGGGGVGVTVRLAVLAAPL